MTLAGENRSTRGKTCPSATLSNITTTWTDPGSNPGLRPATNHLSHGTVRTLLKFRVVNSTNLEFYYVSFLNFTHFVECYDSDFIGLLSRKLGFGSSYNSYRDRSHYHHHHHHHHHHNRCRRHQLHRLSCASSTVIFGVRATKHKIRNTNNKKCI